MKRLLAAFLVLAVSAPAFADNDDYYTPPVPYYSAEPQQQVIHQAYATTANAGPYAQPHYYAPAQVQPQPQTQSQVAPLDSSGIMSSD